MIYLRVNNAERSLVYDKVKIQTKGTDYLTHERREGKSDSIEIWSLDRSNRLITIIVLNDYVQPFS